MLDRANQSIEVWGEEKASKQKHGSNESTKKFCLGNQQYKQMQMTQSNSPNIVSSFECTFFFSRNSNLACIRAEMNLTSCTRSEKECKTIVYANGKTLSYHAQWQSNDFPDNKRKRESKTFLTEICNSLDLSITEYRLSCFNEKKIHRLHFHRNGRIMNTCKKNSLRHLHKFKHYINNICTHTVDPIKMLLWQGTQKNARRNDKKWNGMEKSCHLITSA